MRQAAASSLRPAEPMPENVYYVRPCPWDRLIESLQPSYRVVPVDRDKPEPVSEFPAVVIADSILDPPKRLECLAPSDPAWQIIYVRRDDAAELGTTEDRIFAILPGQTSRQMLERVIKRAFESLHLKQEHLRSQGELRRASSDLETLNRIGVALSTERDTDSLLELILTKSREITCCDAGSIYLVDEDPSGGERLIFKLTQSDSHSPSFDELSLPIDEKSAAGYAAATHTVLNIPDAYHTEHLPFRLNRDFDRRFNYRTRSMLVVPMQNQANNVIGVLQLINAKRHRQVLLPSDEAVAEAVIPFSERSQQLAASLASQAAVALENSILYRDIRRLFEGFVKASITAIESRDPTTFGHSERVAKLTLGLAEAASRSTSGYYAGLRFTTRELQELRYAALLHDFGKVGVRENVLVKAKKLYPPQLEIIRKRFLCARQSVELAYTRKKLELATSISPFHHPLAPSCPEGESGRNHDIPGRERAHYRSEEPERDLRAALAQIEAEQESELRRLDELLEFVIQTNEPGPLTADGAEKLAQLALTTFMAGAGDSEALLNSDEVRLLSIPRGTLDAEERAQTESHVLHSFRFLSQIPWTRELKNIPEIARAHHEKLNGTGYPYGMKGEEIPVEARMMTIADIYDALTASDRPYKRALPVESALEIIEREVKGQLLDPALFDLFVDAKVYQLTAKH